VAMTHEKSYKATNILVELMQNKGYVFYIFSFIFFHAKPFALPKKSKLIKFQKIEKIILPKDPSCYIKYNSSYFYLFLPLLYFLCNSAMESLQLAKRKNWELHIHHALLCTNNILSEHFDNMTNLIQCQIIIVAIGYHPTIFCILTH